MLNNRVIIQQPGREASLASSISARQQRNFRSEQSQDRDSEEEEDSRLIEEYPNLNSSEEEREEGESIEFDPSRLPPYERKRHYYQAHSNQSQKRIPKEEDVSKMQRQSTGARVDDYYSRPSSYKHHVHSFQGSYCDANENSNPNISNYFSNPISKVNNINRKDHYSRLAQERSCRDQTEIEINLITIPEEAEHNKIDGNGPSSDKMAYLNYLNRFRKINNKDKYHQDLLETNKNFKKYGDVVTTDFQEAKLKFYDRFLPDTLKIGNNPYRLLKYQQNRRQHNQLLGRIF